MSFLGFSFTADETPYVIICLVLIAGLIVCITLIGIRSARRRKQVEKAWFNETIRQDNMEVEFESNVAKWLRAINQTKDENKEADTKVVSLGLPPEGWEASKNADFVRSALKRQHAAQVRLDERKAKKRPPQPIAAMRNITTRP